VHDYAKAGVDEREPGERVRVSFGGHFRAVEDVKTESEWEVGGHRETVGDSEAGQDQVRRRNLDNW